MSPGGVELAGHDAGYLQAVWLVASGMGAGLLVALVAVYRRARAQRDLEEAEAVLAADEAAEREG
jgi:predicted histidine transporter YuiF (NhaC family)